MIDQKEGETDFTIKIHYDNMVRYERLITITKRLETLPITLIFIIYTYVIVDRVLNYFKSCCELFCIVSEIYHFKFFYFLNI